MVRGFHQCQRNRITEPKSYLLCPLFSLYVYFGPTGIDYSLRRSTTCVPQVPGRRGEDTYRLLQVLCLVFFFLLLFFVFSSERVDIEG